MSFTIKVDGTVREAKPEELLIDVVWCRNGSEDSPYTFVTIRSLARFKRATPAWSRSTGNW